LLSNHSFTCPLCKFAKGLAVAVSKTPMLSSGPGTASFPPSAENDMEYNSTNQEASSRACQFLVTFHKTTLSFSFPADQQLLPSVVPQGDKPRLLWDRVPARSVVAQIPLHDPILLAAASHVPSGENAKAFGSQPSFAEVPGCAVPVAASQSSKTPPRAPSQRPSGENVSCRAFIGN